MPVRLVSTLTAGLSVDSRVQKALRGNKTSLNSALLAMIADELNLWIWAHGKKNARKPESIFEKLTQQEKPIEVEGFESSEEFEKRRAELIAQKG